MSSAAPRLRRDLTISRQQSAGEVVSVVKDPTSRRFFRFREAERFVAEQLDGETPLEVVRQRTEAELGAALTTDALAAFIRTLGKSGLLEGESARARRRDPRRRIQGSMLYLRIRMLDPNRLLDRLAPRTGFFFTPQFLVLSAALILLAVWTTVTSSADFIASLPRLYRLSTVPVFMVVMFAVISAHELAHGVTCKRFGGEVHEMGFLLIYLQPALYCNVDDAWLFPEKSKRLWVGFAGPYFELFLWSLATLAWRLSDAESAIGYLGLIVMTGSGAKTLLNFNPFIKYDGYYLLSDALEIPNLRRKAYRYIGALLQRAFGGRAAVLEAASRRERRIYLAYGLVAIAGSLSILTYISTKIGSAFGENGGPAAALLAGGLVFLKLRRRIRRLFGKPSWATDDDGEDADEDDGTSEAGPRDTSTPEEVPPKKGTRRSWKRPAVWAALVIAVLAGLFLGRLELQIGGPFNVLPEENADVRAAADGIIETIRVTEGNEVRAGDVIATLSDKASAAELQKTGAEIHENRANLEKLSAGATAEEIQVARADVSKAEEQVGYARSRLARTKQLFAEGLVAPKDLEDAQEAATMAEQELQAARGRLQVTLAGSRPEDVDATRARIERLEAQQRFLREELGLLTVVSPVAGIVATPARELKEMRGRLVAKGDLIAKVYDFKTVTAQIMISEREVEGIQVGQEVLLRARAYPSTLFHGIVTSIATSLQANGGAGEAPGTSAPASAATGSKTLVVATRIDNPSLLLRPEMTGQAKVCCGPRRIVDLIQRRLARTFSVAVWSWW